MSGHEARINDALKQLGEEFRLGMVTVDEYRARRRLLLESWGERDSTTSPGARARLLTATGPVPPTTARAASVPPRPAATKSATGLIVAALVGAALLAAGAYFLLGPSLVSHSASPATAPPPPAVSMAIIGIRRAAEDFLARKTWDEVSINAFLERWRALSDAERAQAREEPALRTLRHELDQNIEAEAQLATPDAAPEARARLELLTHFARELGE